MDRHRGAALSRMGGLSFLLEPHRAASYMAA